MTPKVAMEMDVKKSTGLTLVIVAALGVISLFGYRYVAQRQFVLTQQRQLYAALVDIVDNLHGQLRTLSPSVSGQEKLQEELRKMKEMAGTQREKLRRVTAQAHALPSGSNSLLLQETIEKVDKYAEGFASLSNLNIDADTQKSKAEEMLRNAEELRRAIDTYGSPDKGDTSEVIGRVGKLVANFKQANNAPTPTTRLAAGNSSGGGGGDEGGGGDGYWVNVAYSPYRGAIRGIVARYSSGRNVLARVLTDFDRGAFGGDDLAEWNRQLNLRRALINELDGLTGSMPSGSVYDEHHRLLRTMLSDAVDAMQSFAGSANSGTRNNIRDVSNHNTAVMRRLKGFYGIR